MKWTDLWWLCFWRPVTLYVGGGSSKTTVTNTPAPKTADEIEAQRLMLEELRRSNELAIQMQPLLQQQITQQQGSIDRQAALDRLITPEMQAQQALEDFQRSQRTGATQEELQRIQLEAARQGTRATPEQLAAINEATGAAQAQGESDISRFLQTTLRSINEEAAQASGLRGTDTPMLRLSERAGEEAARQQGQLTSTLQGANANARLNYPLASQQLSAGIASQAQSLNQGALQFQQQLQAQATANRNSLGQSPFSSSLGLGFSTGLAQQRAQAGTQTQSGGGGGLGQFGQAAGGLGALMQGGSMLFSDRRLKSNIVRIGTHPLGIGIYEFDMFGERRTGVMADEVLQVLPEAVIQDAAGYYMVRYDLLV
jgi:hypothetical protein